MPGSVAEFTPYSLPLCTLEYILLPFMNSRVDVFRLGSRSANKLSWQQLGSLRARHRCFSCRFQLEYQALLGGTAPSGTVTELSMLAICTESCAHDPLRVLDDFGSS